MQHERSFNRIGNLSAKAFEIFEDSMDDQRLKYRKVKGIMKEAYDRNFRLKNLRSERGMYSYVQEIYA